LNSLVPFVCNDPENDLSSIGLPEGHLVIEKYLSVPVMLGDDLVGQIAVANPGRDYGPVDVNDLRRLANHFALAIQRLRYEESIKEKERRMNVIFESSNSGIALLDHSSRIIFANSQMSTMFDRDFFAEEPVRYFDLVHPDEREKVEIRYKEIVSGRLKTIYSERRFLRGNGKEFQALVSGRSSYDDVGRFENLVLVVTDITPLKLIEDERQHLQTQLVQSQKLELVGQLAGGVAHDFNNILTGIIGYANLSLITASRSELEEHLHNIVGLADRAAHLTQSLLTFSRKQPFNPRNSDLSIIISRMQKIMGRLIRDNVKLEIQTC
jgi:PAS domain S-box-containing protein